MGTTIEAKLREFIAEYGERGYITLKLMLEEAKSRKVGIKLGDFSIRGIRSRLKTLNIEYNPAPLIVKLEKEIGLIETTYRSTNQRWWRIVDIKALESIVREYEGHGEVELSTKARLLRIQFYSLNPKSILETLKSLSDKKLTDTERLRLKKIAFEDLPLLVKILEEAKSSGEDKILEKEIKVIEDIIALFESIVTDSGEIEELVSSERLEVNSIREH
ncbi:MAG: hypothetical protein QXO93_00050 [Acidilobaceae archaeon]